MTATSSTVGSDAGPTASPTGDPTVAVVATMVPKPGRLAQVLEIIADNVPTVHAEAGCLTYAVNAFEEPERVVFVERWASREALAAHGAAEHMARTGAALADLLEGPTEVLVGVTVAMGTPSQGVF